MQPHSLREGTAVASLRPMNGCTADCSPIFGVARLPNGAAFATSRHPRSSSQVRSSNCSAFLRRFRSASFRQPTNWPDSWCLFDCVRESLARLANERCWLDYWQYDGSRLDAETCRIRYFTGKISGSTWYPSASLFIWLNSPITAITSPRPSKSSPSFCAAAVWELTQ
jgi:hypothetical protein